MMSNESESKNKDDIENLAPIQTESCQKPNESINLIDIDTQLSNEIKSTCEKQVPTCDQTGSTLNMSSNVDYESNDLFDNQTSIVGQSNKILHVMVVGFHHKKGCQIDYCYPPMNWTDTDLKSNNKQPANDNSVHNETCGQLPNVWKTLPSVALPDGAHNYDRDTIYFHLPHPVRTGQTVFGISCYRQVATHKLKERDEDVTRGSVQKSVVVLSELPLYGLIAVKCEMITYAYFSEYDFSKVACLQELYGNLNGLLNDHLLTTSEVFLGLSPRDLVLIFSHKTLVLFKLLLLEKKVLFYKTPVKELCTAILTLLSLFPGMIEAGGLNSCCANVQQKVDHDRKFASDIELIDDGDDGNSNDNGNQTGQSNHATSCTNKLMDEERGKSIAAIYNVSTAEATEENVSKSINQSSTSRLSNASSEHSTPSKSSTGTPDRSELDPFIKHREEDLMDPNIFNIEDAHFTPLLFKLSLQDCGFPLQIFRKRSYCHPYLSLAYLDILADNRVRSFVCGATNYLFKQKRNLFDVIVEIDGAKVDIMDNDLKKKLQLSTEDLRFADYLCKCIMENGAKNGSAESSRTLFDGTSWEGGDEWLRYQFKIYLVQLLKTSLCAESSKEYNSFNACFMNAWKQTHNYKQWISLNVNTLSQIPAGHPFYGQLSISDMKLKLNQAIYGTERGKRINQTVVQTSKVVGTAITSAKTAVYSWWSQLSSKNTGMDSERQTAASASTSISEVVQVNSNSEHLSENGTLEAISTSTLNVSLSSFSLSTLLKQSQEQEENDLTMQSKIKSSN